ncbi:hypothetical protein RJ639_009333 [Escallonia herrerae]|uniref:Uncharacterized protein n=1 Tax=Escallonia herrerae TaxID=1293975 RepID=A0AA89ARN4_9ASTE|nr:hypothetical protein RJ639_009333 [Escallonia herrerae]
MFDEMLIKGIRSNWVMFRTLINGLCANSMLEEACRLKDDKEIGRVDAFNCSEQDIVFSEVDKVEQWKERCGEIARTSIRNMNTLLNALLEIKSSLDRSLDIYEKYKGWELRGLCICCSSDIGEQELWTCSICKDW